MILIPCDIRKNTEKKSGGDVGEGAGSVDGWIDSAHKVDDGWIGRLWAMGRGWMCS